MGGDLGGHLGAPSFMEELGREDAESPIDSGQPWLEIPGRSHLFGCCQPGLKTWGQRQPNGGGWERSASVVLFTGWEHKSSR